MAEWIPLLIWQISHEVGAGTIGAADRAASEHNGQWAQLGSDSSRTRALRNLQAIHKSLNQSRSLPAVRGSCLECSEADQREVACDLSSSSRGSRRAGFISGRRTCGKWSGIVWGWGSRRLSVWIGVGSCPWPARGAARSCLWRGRRRDDLSPWIINHRLFFWSIQ